MRALLIACFLPVILGPPVDKNKKSADGPQLNETKEDWNLGLEYNKYLQEVVGILESDPDFRKKLENAKVDEIRDGTIAKELEFLSHNIRSKLDEVKRQELDRLRKLAQRQHELSQGLDRKHIKIPQHLELRHPSFEVADLQKLIKQTTNDLEEADRQRREEFKKYEMEKKYEKEMRLKSINDTLERKAVQEEMEKMEAKHRNHEKLNHPMTKDQLEEVWEEQDHMDAKDWDPKTFFAMHDLDGNGQWDENEVRILFRKELDKAYDPNNPEDDMKEREEEMERMREHVFRESDTNKDRMISFQEFLAETQREEFEKDPGWDTIEDEELYTDDEFEKFERERDEQIRKMMEAGQLPPNYPYPNIPGMPPVGFQHPGYMYPQVPGGPPLPSLDRNGVPMHGSLPGQPAYPQFMPGQGPPQQQQFGAPQMQQGQYGAPQGQLGAAQMPQGQFGGAQMPQGQFGGAQMPQAQLGAGGQMPQGQFGGSQQQQPQAQMGSAQMAQAGAPQGQMGVQQPQGQFGGQQPQGQMGGQQPQGQMGGQQPQGQMGGQQPQGQFGGQQPQGNVQGQPVGSPQGAGNAAQPNIPPSQP